MHRSKPYATSPSRANYDTRDYDETHGSKAADYDAAMEEQLGSVMRQLDELPCRKDLSTQEKEYRASVLRQIAQRLAQDGPRVAQPSPERGRQFMPFAALKGFGELNAELEREIDGATP